MRALRNAAVQIRTKIGIVNQMVVKAFREQCRVAHIPPLSQVIEIHIICDRQLVVFTVLSLHVYGFSPVLQSRLFQDVTGPLSCPDGVDPEVNDRSSGQEVHFAKSCMHYLICRSTHSETMRFIT